MLESRPEDALVKLVKTVEFVETAETVETVRVRGGPLSATEEQQ